jgi:WD40 repeat protein
MPATHTFTVAVILLTCSQVAAAPPGKPRRIEIPYGQPVWWVSFSPDGQLLASVAGVSARLHTLASGYRPGKPLRERDEHEECDCVSDHFSRIVFSPAGRLMVTVGVNGAKSPAFDEPESSARIRLWNVRTRRNTAEPLSAGEDAERPHAISFSPDGRTLATVGRDMQRTAGKHGVLRFWDTRGRPLGVSASGSFLGALAFSPDGKSISVACEGGVVELRRAADGRLEGQLRGKGNARSVEVSSDGAWLVSVEDIAPGDGVVRLWNLVTREAVDIPGSGRTDVTAAELSPGGRLLATAHADGSIRILALATRELAAKLDGHKGRVNTLAFAPDGRTLASGGVDSTILLWNMGRLGREAKPLPRER